MEEKLENEKNFNISNENAKKAFELFLKLHEKIIGIDISKILNQTIDRIVIEFPDKESNSYFDSMINNLIHAVRDGIDLDLIIRELKKTYKEDVFWEAVKKVVNINMLPYIQSEFIRKMQPDIKYSFLREIIENQILELDYSNNIIQRLNNTVTAKQISTGIRIINLLEDLIVVKRLSRSRFISDVSYLFGFEENDVIFLWDILYKNKQELTNRYIIKQIANLQDDIDYIKEYIDKEPEGTED